MNKQTTAHQPSDAERAAALAELVGAVKGARAFKAPHVAAAREAAVRLARSCLYHDNSQAVTVAAALASIYNGQLAPRVRLDELRWLDWKLQCDLISVIFGTGEDATPDYHLREAFASIGGDDAVEWFERHLTETCEGQKEKLRNQVQRVRSLLTEQAHDFERANPGKSYLLHASKSKIEAAIETGLE